MKGYTFSVRLYFSDETTEVVSIEADSIHEAIYVARLDERVVGVRVLGSIDRKPQVCLAF